MRRPVRVPSGVVPLLALSVVVSLVAVGAARGLWLPNLHNGLLALSFAGVGTYVLFERPGHRLGVLFLTTGTVEAVMFVGRQVGHDSAPGTSDWWAWLGVWPLALALAMTTLSVLSFPDGRLPSSAWRPVAFGIVVMAVGLAITSALWPVDYAATAINAAHPVNAEAPDALQAVWDALAHPVYAAFQLLWIVAVAARWRRADGYVRRQLAWLLGAAGISVAALLLGLVVAGSPVAGLVTAALVPAAAGWAVVHGQHLASYAALTWLSRTEPGSGDRAGELAGAAAQALSLPGAVLWIGREDSLFAVGVWPPTEEDPAKTDLATLNASRQHVRAVYRGTEVIGALSVDQADPSRRLGRNEARLLDDLAAQASLLIEHLDLTALIARQREAGHLADFTQREREVLELMARGLSNVAIGKELFLSVKTVEPVVSAIFAKLGLHADSASNRRVLAVLAFLRA